MHALAALLCFQASRLPARLGSDGDLALLAEQHRSLWDRALIARGFAHLERAASGETVAGYHLEAAIATHHARAASREETEWPEILELYDELLALNPSPVVARAELLASAGQGERAAAPYREALARPCSEPERRFLESRLAGLEGAAAITPAGSGARPIR